jgi:hypothetical protein
MARRVAVGVLLVAIGALAAIPVVLSVFGSPDQAAEAIGTADEAARRFARAGVDSYVVDFESACFCMDSPDVPAHVRVTVRDNRVTLVQGIDRKGSVVNEWPSFAAMRYPTSARSFIPFERTQVWIRRNASGYSLIRLEASASGVPEKLVLDHRRDTIDDEVTYLWRNYRPLG